MLGLDSTGTRWSKEQVDGALGVSVLEEAEKEASSSAGYRAYVRSSGEFTVRTVYLVPEDRLTGITFNGLRPKNPGGQDAF